ncbi:hypothetical protein ACP70R_030005 [Stipagrostis hirtigluma subsp. patula]
MDYQEDTLRDFLQFNGRVVLKRVNNNYNLRSFTEKEVKHITNSYSTLLGKGAFGEVYKGILDDLRPVAVKKYKDGTRKEEFAKEVIVHSQINHKNVVRLLGCCTEQNNLMIVMEFICNGNLYDILHCSTANGRVTFPLDKRLDIAIELADVLSSMHSMYSPVLHGDIKPANILLDENLTPKLSDFGIARLLSTNEGQHTEHIIGSIGYLDPLFSQTGVLTPKSDVYSFGVVLVEMITRKRTADGNTNLILNFTDSIKRRKKVRQMFDEEIAGGKRNMKLLEDIAKLAAECLRLEDKMRPEMVEVADGLRKCRKELQRHKRGEPSVPLESSGDNYSLTQPPTPIPIDPPSKTLTSSVLIISLAELRGITRNFSNDSRIGEGSIGSLYLGELKDGRRSAVRKLYSQKSVATELDGSSFQPDEEFLLQVQAISRLTHNNVVQLLGYCMEGDVCALVHEGKMGVKRPPLSWAQRVKIALGAAEGLEFLHRTPEPCIIHSNITSENILIFDNDVPKIEYHGVSKEPPLPWNSELLERPCPPPITYDPPECERDGRFTTESDTFSFGVVLLELLTGRRVSKLYSPSQSLVTWAKPRLGRDKVRQCVDPRLGEYPLKDVVKMADIAARCLSDDARKRPSMSDIVQALHPLLHGTSGHIVPTPSFPVAMKHQ